MNSQNKIRLATEKDAAGILEIYAPYIKNTAASFESNIPSETEMATRISKYLKKHCWLVYESDGKIGGYAYSSPHRKRYAYQWTMETSVYLAPECQGKGLANKFYDILLEISKRQNYVTVLAGITLPNPASVRFHEKRGFTQIAHYENVGFKFGKWHATVWLTLPLQTIQSPKEIIPIDELELSDLL